MKTVYLVCYEQTDSYYSTEDSIRNFEGENDVLNFISSMFTPTSNQKLKKIFKIDTNQTTIVELNVVLENMQITLKEK